MISELCNAAVAFCVCAGGFTVAILYRSGLLNCLAVFAAAVIYLVVCRFILKSGALQFRNGKSAVSVFFGGYCILSSAVSAYLASTLAVRAGAAPQQLYPLTALLILCLALCFGLSKSDAIRRVTMIVSAFSAAVLIAALVLCVAGAGFETPFAGGVDKGALVLLSAFSVTDMLLMLPLTVKGGGAALYGGLAAHLYGLAMTLVCISVLGKRIFESSAMPWLCAWRSTYITSFMNSFELTAVCFFFIITAVKAGIALKTAFDIFGAGYAAPITLASGVILVALSVCSNLLYAAAAVSVALGVFVPLYALCTKKSGSKMLPDNK